MPAPRSGEDPLSPSVGGLKPGSPLPLLLSPDGPKGAGWVWVLSVVG